MILDVIVVTIWAVGALLTARIVAITMLDEDEDDMSLIVLSTLLGLVMGAFWPLIAPIGAAVFVLGLIILPGEQKRAMVSAYAKVLRMKRDRSDDDNHNSDWLARQAEIREIERQKAEILKEYRKSRKRFSLR